MKTALLIAIPLALLSLLSEPAQAQNKMTKDFFVYKTKFRRAGAEGAFLGSAGIVRKTFGKAYSYERKEELDKDFLRENVSISRPTRVRGSSLTNLESKGMFKFLGLSVNDTIKWLEESKLDLVKFEISQGDLERALNKSKKYRSRIAGISPKGKLRIVTAIWVVVNAEEYTKIESNLKAGAKLFGATVEADGATSAEESWTISPKTIIAYEFVKVEWNKKTGKITGFKVDKTNM